MLKKLCNLHVTQSWLNIPNYFQMPYLCTQCKYRTVNKAFYFHHLQKEHNKNDLDKETTPVIQKYKCTLCDYQTNKKKLLSSHGLIHNDLKLWKCSQCSYETSREYYLRLHTKSIHENFRHRCDLCSFNTSRSNYLKEHIRFVHKDKV